LNNFLIEFLLSNFIILPMTDLISYLFDVELCPELTQQITFHLDKLDYTMLYFTSTTLQEATSPHVLKKNKACSEAAGNGQLEVLKYLRENGCPWGEDACSSAAGNGHLDVLKYLREYDCPWGEDACSSAAGNGHLEVF
jgi:hypothetical protein